MNPEEQDKAVQDLIARVFLPPDLCPSNATDIETILDAAGGEPMDDAQVVRILAKAKGELPVGKRADSEEPAWREDEIVEEERDLVALHKNEGDELPAEIEEKLRQLRERAKREQERESDDVEP